MKKIITTSLILVFALSLATSAFADDAVYHAPRLRNQNGTSTNWAGYAVQTSMSTPQSNAVSDVEGNWVVPTVICDRKNSTYSSAWVGIDGYSDNSVEQIGTEQDCSHGKPSYYAWYEMYPNPSYRINLPVKPGDLMQGEVNYIGNNQFLLTLKNVTTGASLSITKTANVLRQSAEWVIEAPWLGKVLPLANFGTIAFTNSSAILNNVTGAINNSSWQNDKIDMSNSSTLKATTSILSPAGDAFSVIWNSSN